jgi:hypothetical protein
MRYCGSAEILYIAKAHILNEIYCRAYEYKQSIFQSVFQCIILCTCSTCSAKRCLQFVAALPLARSVLSALTAQLKVRVCTFPTVSRSLQRRARLYTRCRGSRSAWAAVVPVASLDPHERPSSKEYAHHSSRAHGSRTVASRFSDLFGGRQGARCRHRSAN